MPVVGRVRVQKRIHPDLSLLNGVTETGLHPTVTTAGDILGACPRIESVAKGSHFESIFLIL